MHETNEFQEMPPESLAASAKSERLRELFLLAGIPLSDEATLCELQAAVERIRQRRRAELRLFLARAIAREIHESATHSQGDRHAATNV